MAALSIEMSDSLEWLGLAIRRGASESFKIVSKGLGFWVLGLGLGSIGFRV